LIDFGIDNSASYTTLRKDVNNTSTSRTSAYDTAHHTGAVGAAGMPFLSKRICFGHGKGFDQDRG
jgi:hypothetical protein